MHLAASTLAILAPVALLNRGITERCHTLNHPAPKVAPVEDIIEARAASLRTYYVARDGYVSQRKTLVETKHQGVVHTVRATSTEQASIKAARAYAAGHFTYTSAKEN